MKILNINSYFTIWTYVIGIFVPRLMIEKKLWQKKRRRIVHFVVSLTILHFFSEHTKSSWRLKKMKVQVGTCFVRLVIQGLIYSYSYCVSCVNKNFRARKSFVSTGPSVKGCGVRGQQSPPLYILVENFSKTSCWPWSPY